MRENIRQKMEQIDKLSLKDEKYAQMLAECVIKERAFDRFTSELTDEQQDLVWGFVMHCEDMSIRKLEIACEHMEFMPRIIPFRRKRE